MNADPASPACQSSWTAQLLMLLASRSVQARADLEVYSLPMVFLNMLLTWVLKYHITMAPPLLHIHMQGLVHSCPFKGLLFSGASLGCTPLLLMDRVFLPQTLGG